MKKIFFLSIVIIFVFSFTLVASLSISDLSNIAYNFFKLVNNLFPSFNPSTTITKGNSRAAYNSQENRFFEVWTDGRRSPGSSIYCYKEPGCNNDVYGAFVDSNLNVGQEIPIAIENGNKDFSDIAYNSKRNEYLVVYQRLDGDFNIYAARLNKDGQLMNLITICQDRYDQWEPTVAYDSINDRYLVTWMGFFAGTDGSKDVKVQVLSGDGAKIGQSHIISLEEGSTFAPGKQERSVAVFIPEEKRYVVVWEDEGRLGGSGTVLDQDGNIVITPKNFFYQKGGDRVIYTQASYKSYNKEVMVVWQEGLGSIKKIIAQRLSTSGQKIGEKIIIDSNAGSSQQYQNPRPGIACDDSNGSCLIGWFNWNAYENKLQFVNANGEKIGSSFEGLGSRPTIIFNFKDRFFLVVKSDNPFQFKKVSALSPLSTTTTTSSCTPNQWDSGICRRCKSDGTWNADCTDFGQTSDPGFTNQKWCDCCVNKCPGVTTCWTSCYSTTTTSRTTSTTNVQTTTTRTTTTSTTIITTTTSRTTSTTNVQTTTTTPRQTTTTITQPNLTTTTKLTTTTTISKIICEDMKTCNECISHGCKWCQNPSIGSTGCRLVCSWENCFQGTCLDKICFGITTTMLTTTTFNESTTTTRTSITTSSSTSKITTYKTSTITETTTPIEGTTETTEIEQTTTTVKPPNQTSQNIKTVAAIVGVIGVIAVIILVL